MARGTSALIALLGAATLLFIFALAFVATVIRAYPGGAPRGNFWDMVWGNLMRTLDPGTMGGDTGWAYRTLMLVVTLGGLVVVASLIGIVSGAFDQRMAQLRQGRSRVIEKDHTLILGWNGQLFTILQEVCASNASERRNTIVILADRDTLEMESEIRARIPHPGRTSIICRRGTLLAHVDLALGSPGDAKSIVVLSPDDTEHPDSAVLKTVMALSRHMPAIGGPSMVAELRNSSNYEAALLAGQGRARWVLADDLISRMTVQACLHRGLSAVCTELLAFEGNEIYFDEQPDLAGWPYVEAQLAFPQCTLIGMSRDGHIQLNPAPLTRLAAGDQLILVAEDDSSIRLEPSERPVVVEETTGPNPSGPPERVLILGYNSTVQAKLTDLAAYLPAGSSVVVASDIPHSGLAVPKGLALQEKCADTASRDDLEALGIGDFDHVLVVACREAMGVQEADAKTLITLLHLRDLVDRHGYGINIVSEMLDDQNRELAEVTRADDFIVSDRLTSLLLSQVSENPGLVHVFEQLFSSGGSEIYLRPVELYVSPGREVDFYEVAGAATRRRETALGFRTASEVFSRELGYGVHLNPVKAERRRFAPGDAIIVLAESTWSSAEATPQRLLTSSAGS